MNKLHLVIVGHVDHGKSSLIGRILYETDSVPSDKIDSIKMKDGHMEFSHLLDHLQEEREQEITIETTRTYFRYLNKEFVIIDAPGHVEFTKNMITGASQAEAAILIVDAGEGIKEQTIRHSYLLSLLDIKNIIVVINKMDKIDYDQKIYDGICNELAELFKRFDMDIFYFVPTSVTEGANICHTSKKLSWYKGEPLINLLYGISNKEDEGRKAAIFPLQDVYKINDRRLANGRLEAGELSAGNRIFIYPGKRVTYIESIVKFGETTCKKAQEGESFGITTTEPVFLERGNIITNSIEVLKESAYLIISAFWMNTASLGIGDEITVRCSTQETKGIVKEIKKVINTKTLEIENSSELQNLYAGEIHLSLKKNICISQYSVNKNLGRVVLLRAQEICGGGIVTKKGRDGNE